jgi:IQ domain-containing protein G
MVVSRLPGAAAPAEGTQLERLKPEQSHRVIAVLEETAEKLAFLGSITPDVLQHRDELSKFVGDEISRIIQQQRTLEGRYEDLITQRSALKGLANKTRYKEVQGEIQDVSRALRESTRNLCRNLKDNPNISGNLTKIQRERAEMIDLVSRTARELGDAGRFDGIAAVVEDDRLSQNRRSELVRREKEAANAVKKLESDLSGERSEHTRQVQAHKHTMAELRETLTEVKGKTSVDVKYSRKENSAKVSSLLRVNRQTQRTLEEQVSLTLAVLRCKHIYIYLNSSQTALLLG